MMPIYDQYLIGSHDDFSGSYTDSIIYSFASGTYSNQLNKRRVLGTKTDNNISWEQFNDFDLMYSDYLKFVSASTLGKNYNFTKHNSAIETFWDSYVPSPIDYHIANGCEPVYLATGLTSSQLLSGQEHTSGTFTISFLSKHTMFSAFEYATYSGFTVADKKWDWSFPFEGRYKNLSKLTKLSVVLPKTYTIKVGHIQGLGNTPNGRYLLSPQINMNTFQPIIYKTVFTQDIVTYDDALVTFGTFDVSKSYAKDTTTNEFFRFKNGTTQQRTARYLKGISSPTIVDAYKTYFGIFRQQPLHGTPNGGTERFAMCPDISYSDWATENEAIGVGFNPKIAGWKYGLYGAIPHETSMIFRRDHFGHPRDMLEQRPYTKFLLKDKTYTTTQSPVIVTFISGTDAYVTNSLNLDTNDSGIYHKEYASGKPFIDRTIY
jgi:hypothetical protein